jgi:hypothetical protein
MITTPNPQPPELPPSAEQLRDLALDLLQLARIYAYWHVHAEGAGVYEIIRCAEKILRVPESNRPENDYVWHFPNPDTDSVEATIKP